MGTARDLAWEVAASIIRQLRALVLVEVDLLRERFVANIGTARDLAREVPTGPTGLVKSALKILEDLPPPSPPTLSLRRRPWPCACSEHGGRGWGGDGQSSATARPMHFWAVNIIIGVLGHVALPLKRSSGWDVPGLLSPKTVCFPMLYLCFTHALPLEWSSFGVSQARFPREVFPASRVLPHALLVLYPCFTSGMVFSRVDALPCNPQENSFVKRFNFIG